MSTGAPPAAPAIPAAHPAESEPAACGKSRPARPEPTGIPQKPWGSRRGTELVFPYARANILRGEKPMSNSINTNIGAMVALRNLNNVGDALTA
ncbi:MAG TPA: hypothetical protein VGN75_05350, partial [Kaistia sp.]|nr:hypothetical protein [Kaistia sp.]